jgi:phage/plasmid-like protein (TIGR03299 family)
MAHQISTMAFTGDTPWHALGSRLPAKQPIEVWARKAGMDWTIRETPVRFNAAESGSDVAIQAFEDHKVLFRSDNCKPLSVVSKRYRVVQPRVVLEFYRDLSQAAGYELETAGILKEGRKFWALARTGKETKLRGNDLVQGYILLATSCDGSLATVATHTTVRVVCANTLAVALDNARGAVRVPHSTTFDPSMVKSQLGIAVSQWDNFMARMRELTDCKVNDSASEKFLRKLICHTDAPVTPTERLTQVRALKTVQDLYGGKGRGADLASAKGTAWGLLNAVTQFVDHERRARSQDHRLYSAWFGVGASLKDRALAQALELVA